MKIYESKAAFIVELHEEDCSARLLLKNPNTGATAHYMMVPLGANKEEQAPRLCAGITTFFEDIATAMRRKG